MIYKILKYDLYENIEDGVEHTDLRFVYVISSETTTINSTGHFGELNCVFLLLQILNICTLEYQTKKKRRSKREKYLFS